MVALRALTKYKDVRLARSFLEMVEKGPVSNKIAALEALCSIPDTRLLKPLLQILRETSEPAVQEVALVVVSQICESLGKAVPRAFEELPDLWMSARLEELPDLNLKLSEES